MIRMVRLQNHHLNKLNLYLDYNKLIAQLTASTDNLMANKKEDTSTNFSIDKLIGKKE